VAKGGKYVGVAELQVGDRQSIGLFASVAGAVDADRRAVGGGVMGVEMAT